jgi:hypothetical protein
MDRLTRLIALILMTASAAIADDWPQFLGADGSGVVASANLARQWPEAGPRTLWSASVGEGFGGAAIRDDKVYIIDRADDQFDIVRCFDLTDGKELWQVRYERPGRVSYPGSRSTPAVTDTHVYATGPFGDVYGVSLATHESVWRRSLTDDYDAKPPSWGFAVSPTVVDGRVIVAPMSGKAAVVALDPKTGDTVWESQPLGGDAYDTPRLVTLDGKPQLVFITRQNIAGIDPTDGNVLWRFGDYKQPIPIPSPTPIGADRLFVTGGYNGGSLVLEVKRDGDAWSAHEVARQSHGSQIHPALRHGDQLYANINENGKMDRGLACMNLDGSIRWQTHKDPDIDRGGLILVGDLLLVLGGEDGVLRLIEPNAEKYVELASAAMFDGLGRRNNNIWAPLAFADGKLLIRSQSQLKCVDLTAP